jgi:hypothetical protein
MGRSPCSTAPFAQCDDFSPFASFSESMSKPEYEISNNDDVSHEDIQPETELYSADLSEAVLTEINLTDRVL